MGVSDARVGVRRRLLPSRLVELGALGALLHQLASFWKRTRWLVGRIDRAGKSAPGGLRTKTGCYPWRTTAPGGGSPCDPSSSRIVASVVASPRAAHQSSIRPP